MKIIGLALLLFGCAGPPSKARPSYTLRPTYESEAIRRMAESSMRIAGDCDGDGRADGWGTGTAISDRLMLTAHHVAHVCDGSGDEPRFWIYFANKAEPRRVTVDKETESPADATRMRLRDDEPSFETYSPIAFYTPRIGQVVYTFAGSTPPFWAFKSGHVSMIVGGTQFTTSTHAVPGNSGSAIFDEKGYIIGILWGGMWDPAKEFVAAAFMPDVWKDLVP